MPNASFGKIMFCPICVDIFMYSCINVVNISIQKKIVSLANILIIPCAHIYNKILIPVIATHLLH